MLLAIDGNHMVHLFFHLAAAEARKETGDAEAIPDPAVVVEWMLTRLDNLKRYAIQIAAKHGLEHNQRCVVFDPGTKSKRTKLIPEYKANRLRVAGVYEAVAEMRIAVESSDDWTCLTAPDNYEADDLLASIADQEDQPVIIHSADKDMNQCLQDGWVGLIKRSNVDAGMEKNEHGISIGGELVANHYNEANLIKDYGFRAYRWVDYQCLVGDNADNVQGAKWIGEVAAKRIMQHSEPFEELDPKELKLNKRQLAEWPDFISRLPVLREVFTLDTSLPYEL